MARTFPMSELPKVLWSWNVFSILAFRCASRHNGANIMFISRLARWLRTHRFSEPTFRLSRAIKMGKTQCLATFLPFRAPASSFFFLFLFSDSSHLCSSHLSILSQVWLQNFLRPCHYMPLHYMPLHYMPLHYIPLSDMPLNYIPFHYIPFRYIPLH